MLHRRPGDEVEIKLVKLDWPTSRSKSIFSGFMDRNPNTSLTQAGIDQTTTGCCRSRTEGELEAKLFMSTSSGESV